jgi:hypothetical protein
MPNDCSHLPNPTSVLHELAGTAMVAAHLASAGQPSLNPMADFKILQTIAKDPYLQRVGWCIDIGGSKWATARAKPLGFYGFIAAHNTAIDGSWDGGSEVNPYGTPCTPA